MDLALAELRQNKTRNYTATARKWKISEHTLRRHFLNQTVSTQEFHRDFQCLLSQA
jgi:hypothetical protein